MKPEIDETMCIGDGICADICPEVFEMGEDNLSHVINPNPSADLNDKIQEAVDACPTSAISISD